MPIQSTGIFLINKNDKILLVHPSGWYNKSAPYYMPKETIEPGDTILSSCQRVITEELGLNLNSVLIQSNFTSVQQPNKLVYCFYGIYYGNKNSIKLDWENDKYVWVNFEEAKKIIRIEYIRAIEQLQCILIK